MSKSSEGQAAPSATAIPSVNDGSPTPNEPPAAPSLPSAPAAPVTPPASEPGRASQHGLVNEVKALASLVQVSLEHMRAQESQRVSDLAQTRDDYRAATDLLEEKVADLTALHERMEEALVAHIKLIQTQADRR